MPFIGRPTTVTGLTIGILKYCAALHMFSSYIGHQQQTAGPSMLPTLNQGGDVVWVSTYHRRGRGIAVGDVISFRHPLVPGMGASKRVLGLPGDWIVVDGAEGEGRMLKVPEGHCWVEGDHTAWSRDSKTYGPLPLALIKGKVVGRILPFGQRKWMENPFEDGS